MSSLPVNTGCHGYCHVTEFMCVCVCVCRGKPKKHKHKHKHDKHDKFPSVTVKKELASPSKVSIAVQFTFVCSVHVRKILTCTKNNCLRFVISEEADDL